MILELTYTNEIRKEASHHASLMVESAQKLGRSFYSYKGQRPNNHETAYLGKIAELIIAEWLTKNQVKIIESPCGRLAYDDPATNFNGDFLIETTDGPKRLELKTKTINCYPAPFFDCGSTRIVDGCWGYLFTRIQESLGILYICGWLTTKEFKIKAAYRKKGTLIRNSSTTSFECLGNEYVVKINQLREPLELIKELK